jgi:hypothetical protein
MKTPCFMGDVYQIVSKSRDTGIVKSIFLFLILMIPYVSAGNQKVEQWDYFEIQLKGPSEGNSFVNVELSTVFSDGYREYNLRDQGCQA